MERDKEIFANTKDKLKKEKITKAFKKESIKDSYASLLEDFHSVDIIG